MEISSPFNNIKTKRPAYIEINGSRFKLGRLIGEGTYSKVCLAYRNVEDRSNVLACKVMNKNISDADFSLKFLPRELSIIRVLCHPNIVKITNIAEDVHNVYIFMEYCSHGDLLDYIRHNGRISEKKSKILFRQIALAVEYLHDMNVAHRDLKCENILLTKRNIVKLGDFGFARYCGSTATGRRELSRTYCGSAAYAAPEILEGRPYNPKMYDVWSLGCILYIMLTAQMPFDEGDLPKMLKIQQNRSIRFVLKKNDKISQSVKLLIRQLLEPDVSKRATVTDIVISKWLMTKNSENSLKESYYAFTHKT